MILFKDRRVADGRVPAALEIAKMYDLTNRFIKCRRYSLTWP